VRTRILLVGLGTVAALAVIASPAAAAPASFPNCTAAHNAGRYNIPKDDPNYRPALDRDNDGVACEGTPPAGQTGRSDSTSNSASSESSNNSAATQPPRTLPVTGPGATYIGLGTGGLALGALALLLARRRRPAVE